MLVGLLVPAIFLGYATLQFLVGMLRFGWSNALKATSRAVFVGILALLLEHSVTAFPALSLHSS